MEDTAGKFFAKKDGVLVEPSVVFPASAVVAAADAASNAIEELSNLVGRNVEPWKEWPGKVVKFFPRSHEFQVRFFDPENPEKRAKKTTKVSHEALQGMLLPLTEEELLDDEDEVLEEEEEAIEEEGKSGDGGEDHTHQGNHRLFIHLRHT